MKLVWNDEFDSGSVPNSANWGYDTGSGGWGNNESQTYTSNAANAYVSGGTLKIAAINSSGMWTSARIKTKGLRDFTYGYIEVRAKVPVGTGTWPAIWMLPTDNAYGVWPNSGEIDIMEHSQVTGMYSPCSTLHCAAGYGGSGISLGSRKMPTIGSEFHTYAIEWTSGYIRTFYDNELLGQYFGGSTATSKSWPFDQDFHILLNLAMGGTLGGSIDSSLTSQILEVDYVRVYQ